MNINQLDNEVLAILLGAHDQTRYEGVVDNPLQLKTIYISPYFEMAREELLSHLSAAFGLEVQDSTSFDTLSRKMHRDFREDLRACGALPHK